MFHNSSACPSNQLQANANQPTQLDLRLSGRHFRLWSVLTSEEKDQEHQQRNSNYWREHPTSRATATVTHASFTFPESWGHRGGGTSRLKRRTPLKKKSDVSIIALTWLAVWATALWTATWEEKRRFERRQLGRNRSQVCSQKRVKFLQPMIRLSSWWGNRSHNEWQDSGGGSRASMQLHLQWPECRTPFLCCLGNAGKCPARPAHMHTYAFFAIDDARTRSNGSWSRGSRKSWQFRDSACCWHNRGLLKIKKARWDHRFKRGTNANSNVERTRIQTWNVEVLHVKVEQHACTYGRLHAHAHVGLALHHVHACWSCLQQVQLRQRF